MAVQLAPEVIELIQDPEAVKVLATTDENGFPHVVFKQSLQVGPKGNLLLWELLESSQTNKNLVRAIWFNRKIAVNIRKGPVSYQIKGIPVKAIISGPEFKQHYLAVRAKRGDVDLAAVWVIEPEQVLNQSFAVKQAEEEATRPYFKHLDRLAKQ